jgi:hypothetical protein
MKGQAHHTTAAGHAQRSVRSAVAASCLAGLLTVLAGCNSLLPQGSTEAGQAWSSFDQAKSSIESIRPFESRREDVHALGLDPYKNATVTLLTYSDLVQRFGTGNALRAEQLERGVRECFEAGRRCAGYQVQQRVVQRKRVGSFWLDMLNFRRETDTDGWSFNALIVFVDDLVVMTLYGGQPKIHEHEVSRNPLGPLQGAAEAAAGTLGR